MRGLELDIDKSRPVDISSSVAQITKLIQNGFRITGLERQEQTITRAILPRNQLMSVSNSQRGRICEQIFDSSTTFLNPLVGTNSLCGKLASNAGVFRGARISREEIRAPLKTPAWEVNGKRTVGFFSLASHALRACEARARKTLTPRFTDFFTDFEKKTDCSAV